jgi:hypothetical protein
MASRPKRNSLIVDTEASSSAPSLLSPTKHTGAGFPPVDEPMEGVYGWEWHMWHKPTSTPLNWSLVKVSGTFRKKTIIPVVAFIENFQLMVYERPQLDIDPNFSWDPNTLLHSIDLRTVVIEEEYDFKKQHVIKLAIGKNKLKFQATEPDRIHLYLMIRFAASTPESTIMSCSKALSLLQMNPKALLAVSLLRPDEGFQHVPALFPHPDFMIERHIILSYIKELVDHSVSLATNIDYWNAIADNGCNYLIGCFRDMEIFQKFFKGLYTPCWQLVLDSSVSREDSEFKAGIQPKMLKLLDSVMSRILSWKSGLPFPFVFFVSYLRDCLKAKFPKEPHDKVNHILGQFVGMRFFVLGLVLPDQNLLRPLELRVVVSAAKIIRQLFLLVPFADDSDLICVNGWLDSYRDRAEEFLELVCTAPAALHPLEPSQVFSNVSKPKLYLNVQKTDTLIALAKLIERGTFPEIEEHLARTGSLTTRPEIQEHVLELQFDPS